MIYKTLSVKQPWSYLQCAKIKDIENRTWKLPERHRNEWVLIHASGEKPIEWRWFDIFTIEQYRVITHVPHILDQPLSAIIGAVKYSDCVINHPSIWAEKTERFILNEGWPNGRPANAGKKGDIYNWVVEDPILFDKPILNVKGKLSFWDFDLPEEYSKLLK